MTPARLILPQPLRDQLAAEAGAAFPRECCGLIEGVIDGERARAYALHPSANLAEAPDRFEIDPRLQIALLKTLRGTESALIGCYHSHPNGRAEPSPRDLAGASEDGFIWLIQPVTQTQPAPPAAHLFAQGGFHPLALGF